MGTIYLLHYETPVGDTTRPIARAQHYTGWANDVEARTGHHRSGTSHAALPTYMAQKGIDFVVARTRPGTKNDERKIKNAGGATRYCPVCTTKPREGVWAI